MDTIVRALLGLAAAAAIFVPVERLTALRRGQRVFRSGWRADALHFTVTSLLAQGGLLVAVAVPIVVVRATVAPLSAPVLGSLPVWVQLLAGIAIADVLAYFAHRAAHTVPCLWRFHRVHHSIEEIDWLASARLHPLDQIWTRGVAVIGLGALGFTSATFGLYLAITPLQALFVHANTRLRFGPLRWVVGTPEWHHWHHAADPDARDRNFAAQLPVIDVLFGTAFMPRHRRPTAYGLALGEPPMPAGWFAQLVAPFHPTIKKWPLGTREMSSSSR